MSGYYHAMLRSVFAIALIAACHPAPAPTVVRAAPLAAAPTAPASPIRQDFETLDAPGPGPLHEVIATGHECKQEQPTPIDGRPMPSTAPTLQITATPAGCARPEHGVPRTPSDMVHTLADR